MLGVGIAASTLVGQQLMRGRPDLATRATWTALTFALAYTALCGLFFLLTPDLFLLGHRAGADPQEFGQLRDVAVILLRFVAAYCLFDAMQIIFAGRSRGRATRGSCCSSPCWCPPSASPCAGSVWVAGCSGGGSW